MKKYRIVFDCSKSNYHIEESFFWFFWIRTYQFITFDTVEETEKYIYEVLAVRKNVKNEIKIIKEIVL